MKEQTPLPPKTAVLLIHCPDRKGLVATIAEFLYHHNGNILHADQHQDRETGLFLMRVEWDLTDFNLDSDQFRAAFEPIATQLNLAWRLELSTTRPQIAIFVSQYDHCLIDLLYRQQSGELACDIACIISNHGGAQALAEFYHVPFHYVPVTPSTKPAAEAEQHRLIRHYAVDCIVLARYMQILSPEFVAHFPQRIINVHHSFLPAFSGARPYHRAYERGVKLIGATSHYVTATLDEGPIIEQDVLRVSHHDQLSDFIQKGRDLEKVVLARAVRWHIDHRVLVYGNKTVVFE